MRNIIYISVIILIILIFIIFLKRLNNLNTVYISYYNQNIDHNLKQLKNTNIVETIIQKIIHKIAPKDKTKWRPIWTLSHKSWEKYYASPEYNIIMWNDDDDINNFIKNKYNWFYPIYCEYPHKIQRIDIVRYFILYEYGGIYADMDYECFKNFYELLPNNKISLVENSINFNINRKLPSLENSLMASPRYHNFWLKIIKLATNKIVNKIYLNRELYILNSTGPSLISKLYDNNIINILSKIYFNSKNKTDITIGMHYLTKTWVSPIWKHYSDFVKKYRRS